MFKNFKDKCIKIYELDSAHFVSAPGLAWEACLKKTGVNLELLTDIDMLLMVEEVIRGGMFQALYSYTKANSKYMNNNDKSIESSYMYLDANNLHGWAMSQKLPVDGFKWINDLSQFNAGFIKKYDKNSDIGYFLEVDVEYLKKLFNLYKDLPFLSKREKSNKCKKLICNIEDKKKIFCSYKSFKTSTNQGLKLRKIHRVIQFNWNFPNG